MSNDTHEDLTKIVSLIKELKQDLDLNHSQHTEEHEYLRTIIADHKASEAFWLKMREKAAGTGVVGLIGLCCTAIYFMITHPAG